MATVTDPIMLDSTGQDIKDQISALNTKIQTLNTLLADLGLVSITPISQEDYDALSQAEKLAGVFDIYDAAEPDIDGNKVSYDSNTSVNDKIDSQDLKTDAEFLLNLINGWDGQVFVTVNRNGRITCLSGALIYTSNVTSPIFARADTSPQNCITNRSVPVATQGGAIYNTVGGSDVIGFGQDAQGWYATLNSQDHNVVMNAVYGRA